MKVSSETSTGNQDDLFDPSSAVFAENAVIEPILLGDLDEAVIALQNLREAYPGDSLIGPLDSMLSYVSHEASADSLKERVRIAADVEQLRREVEPAARRILDPRVAAWLRQRYARLARRAEGLNFDPQWPQTEAGWLLVLAGKDKRALEKLQTIDGWHLSTDVAHAMLGAAMRVHGVSGAWKAFCEFAWRKPDQARAWAEGDDRRDLVPFKMMEAFDAWAGDELGFEWFPAWSATQFPVLSNDWLSDTRAMTRQVPSSLAESAMYAMADLFKAIRSGDDGMEARRAINALEPRLLQAYLKSRPFELRLLQIHLKRRQNVQS